MKNVFILYSYIFLLCQACKRKDTQMPTPVTPTPQHTLSPRDSIKNMARVRNWHGDYHFLHLSYPDTTYSLYDTFALIVYSDTAVSVPNDISDLVNWYIPIHYKYYNDSLIHFQYEGYSGGPTYFVVDYYYKKDSIYYSKLVSGSINTYYYDLSTP